MPKLTIQQFYSLSFPIMDLGNITLRELRESDAQDYFEYMNDERVADFINTDNSPATIEDAKRDLLYWRNVFHSYRSIYWGIATSNTDKLIGTVGFNSIYSTQSKGEISYDLNYEYWGKGIMSQAILVMLSLIDQTIELTRVQATVMTNNTRSIKLLEKCGFIREGLLRNYEIVKGASVDSYMYSRIKDVK